jgi:hypothetical protein
MAMKAAKTSTDNVFEGADHVLRGLHQQLKFWQGLETEGLPARADEQKEMVAALTKATEALRDGVKRAKAGSEA